MKDTRKKRRGGTHLLPDDPVDEGEANHVGGGGIRGAVDEYDTTSADSPCSSAGIAYGATAWRDDLAVH